GGSWAAHPELGDAGPLCIEQHGRQLAAALLSENGGVVELQFVVKGAPPAALRKRLIDQVFARPEMRGRRPLQASLPLGDADLLDGLRRHCATWQSRAAGSTCLVDATIRDDPLVSAAEPAARPHSGRRHAGRHRATRTAAS
ncbi:MAG: hypothetical protein JOY61_12680, partial [Chloroflexi bacterium]|nr:hypothetical protein [Chloroflexota bacterium]